MDIRVDREAEVPIHEQLREQIVFLIATGSYPPGKILPSVRELARRCRINRNTVSRVYSKLVDEGWLIRKAGRQMRVRAAEDSSSVESSRDLECFINSVIRNSRERGYTLKQLHKGFSDRIMEHPPDHILLVVREPGLRTVLQKELREQLRVSIDACSPTELSSNRNLTIGAQVVTSPGVIREVIPMVPGHRPPVPLVFSPATKYLELIHKLTKPSIMAVVSLSERFLVTARGLLSPLMGRQHVLKEFLFSLDKPQTYKAFDLVYCDSIAFHSVQTQKKVLYRLIEPQCLINLSKLLKY